MQATGFCAGLPKRFKFSTSGVSLQHPLFVRHLGFKSRLSLTSEALCPHILEIISCHLVQTTGFLLETKSWCVGASRHHAAESKIQNMSFMMSCRLVQTTVSCWKQISGGFAPSCCKHKIKNGISHVHLQKTFSSFVHNN